MIAEKTPKEMTDVELCKAFKEIDEHICNDDVSHSYSYEYGLAGELSKEMTARGFTENGTNCFLDKDGNEIEY